MKRPRSLDSMIDAESATDGADRAPLRNGSYPKDFPNLLRQFHDVCSRQPDAIAVSAGGRSLTYAELDEQSNRLAHWLIGRGVGPDVAVAFCLQKSLDAYVILLGILKSGGGYVPLDPTLPRDRLAVMIDDASPALILTAATLTERLPLRNAPIVIWDELTFELDDCPRSSPLAGGAASGDDDHLGYILFTSGSTGRPKGVAMPRGPLRRLIEWQVKNSSVGSGDATMQFASLGFDVSFQEMFATWATGGILVVPTDDERKDPGALLLLIARENIRRVFLPVVALQQIAEAHDSRDVSTSPLHRIALTEVITAGEQLQITAALRKFFRDRPGATLHNHYGPTEAHVVTAFTLSGSPDDWPTLPPIGRPIDSAFIYLCDADGRQVANGETGEIWIGGHCVARGYVNQPDLTAQRFRADPFHDGGRVYKTGDLALWNEQGQLDFLGRLDHQVKIRGYRVEPGEIEAALVGHPGIREAVVVATVPPPSASGGEMTDLGERRLVAYVVPAGEPPTDLRDFLSARLPDYMIPAAFVPLNRLPLTPSGKVDRKSLPAPSRQRPSLSAPFAAPRNATERAIAEAWQRVLNLDSVGIHDPFFDLGGNSLALARVHVILRDRLQMDVPLARLFERPTIAQLALELDESGPLTADSSVARRALQYAPAHRLANEPIAIIGMAGRFPGAANINEFWNNLCRGDVSIRRFTDDELRSDGIPEHLIADPNYIKSRGMLDEADRFDAAFFGYQPREAELTDPQHRLILQAAWSALEHAGYCPERCDGRTGVFAGASMNTYLLNNVFSRRSDADAFLAEFQSGGYGVLVGNDKDYLATRIAYKLNLRGPALTIQTACSTSLVAVCEAVESLRAGACDVALAGGVSVTFPQHRGALYQEGAITSPDGTCRPFDADAAGTVFGEGVAMVVLKRLSDAEAAGDTIFATINGVGLSNDGADKLSYLAPSVDGQVEAITRALGQSGIDPATIGFVEAHGTGTPMGDPIEVAALAKAFGSRGGRQCVLGSVKGNVGHLEAAAGVTGLIKATLAVYHGLIPPTPHFRRANPGLELERGGFRINSATEKWDSDGPRRAGVTSLGVGGTNAHIVLEQSPPPRPTGPTWAKQLIVVSARTAAALEPATTQLANHFKTTPDIDLADAAYTLQNGRRAFEHRRFVIASASAEAATALKNPDLRRDGQPATAPAIAFVFPGQGSQALGMARQLYDSEPTFRSQFDLCAEILAPHVGCDLREFLRANDKSLGEKLNRTRFTQPYLFALEFSLAQMWLGWGIQPRVMFGHSIGEFVAACLAGIFSLEDALRVVARRGALIDDCPTGTMLAVRLKEDEVRAKLPPDLDIAAINGPTQTVLAGTSTSIDEFCQQLTERSIACKRLTTSHAFHSRMLEPAVNAFREFLGDIKLQPPRRAFVSCITGTWITHDQATSPEYWAGQLRQPVRGAEALQTLAQDGSIALIEVGPGRALSNLAKQVIDRSRLSDAVAGLDTEWDDLETILSTMGRLWLAGVEIDWKQFQALSFRRRVPLPTYPFERQRYWIEPFQETPGVRSQESELRGQKSESRPQKSGLDDSVETPTCLIELQQLLGELAGTDTSRIVPDVSFFELGFDSLFLTQAVQAIQAKFGVRVGFRQLFEQLSTPASLAKHLAANRQVRPVEPLPPPVVEERPAGFGALAPIERISETDWDPARLEFLREFIARYGRKTAGSKRHVQDHRRAHADPRTVSGFSQLWKEIVYPLVIDRSAGPRLWDIDGNEYFDLLNGFGPDFLGHSPPFVIDAVEKQLRAGYEVGPLSPLAGQLARLVCELTGLDRASFVCTGSEAVQAALRAARTVTGRDKVVTFARDYHGNFDEVLLRGGATNAIGMPSAPGVPRSAVSNMIVLEYGTPESLETIRKLAPELAAVLVEPVQSRRPEWQPREFLQELHRITARSETCLIFDEVITGFRLHPGGAQAVFGVKADLATYGKIVGGGMPIGVVAGQAKFMDAFDGGFWQFGDESFPEAGRTFFAGTFVRHPLALAAGIATLQYIQRQGPQLQEALNARADRFVARLNSIVASAGVPFEIVNCGSLMFFRVLGGSKEASLLFYLLRERGVFILEGFPSYLSTAHSETDLQSIVEAFQSAVSEMQSNGFFAQKGAAAKPKIVQPLPTSELLPMTDAQRELWLAAQSGEDASRAFNETCTVDLRGPLNTETLVRAIQQLVERHESLRAVFDSAGGGQRFIPNRTTNCPIIDLSAKTLAEREQILRAMQEAADADAFDLANGPLVRFHLARLDTNHHALLMTAHHIACDGWSYDILLHELGALYSGVPLPPADSFRAYATASRGSPDLPFWNEIYRKVAAPIDLPPDHPRPACRTFCGGRVTAKLGAERSKRVKQLAAKLSCTPYVLLLAVFDTLLHRLSGQTDLVVGIPTAGQTLNRYGSPVGHCVNFLPLRQQIDTESTFADLVRSVQCLLLDALEHRDFTYVSLLRDLPPTDPNRPLVTVGFNLDPALGDLGFSGIVAEVVKNPKHFVNLELHWNLVDAGDHGLELEAEFNTDLFDAGTVNRWAECYFQLLDDASDRPDANVASLQWMSAAERHRVLVEWNATSRPIPDKCVHELFAEQSRSTPNATALLWRDEELSYSELNRRANRLAHRLRSIGIGPDDPVGVLLPRGPDMIVAFLAILKAGGAYLPLDPTHPAARTRLLLQQARAKAAVVESQANELVGGMPIVSIADAQSGNEVDPPSTNCPDHLSALLFTSGSTGTPKGVMVTHRGMVRLLFNSGFCAFGPERTFAWIAPATFDAATFEIWGALLHGARLAVYPDAVPDLDELGHFLERYHVDTLWLTAGLFNAMVDHNVSALRNVKQLLTGGEALSVSHVRRALAALPTTAIINGYGPTETTTFATTFSLPPFLPNDCPSIPIGRPIGNTTVAVLDSQKQCVPIGMAGELYLGGSGVARGYVNDPECIAGRFVASPVPELTGTLYRTGDRVRWHADGNLEFLGRVDDQVKIRGHRIEPGETQTVLASHDDVAAAAVLACDEGADARLIAYVVGKAGSRCDPDDLRGFLAERLPAYMIPAAFVFLDRLPLTANGKLDRAALSAPLGDDKPRHSEARTDAERDVREIWAKVLGRPGLGVDDNFFDIGGHSLKAVELIAAIRDQLGHALPLSALYQAPTLAQFAAVIQNRLEAGTETSLVPLQTGGSRPPLFMVAGVGGHVFAFHKFARLLGADQPTFGVKAIGIDGTRPPPERIEDIAAEYVREIVSVRPDGPCVLAGYSIGAITAFEVALQLQKIGRSVPVLVAIDAAAPEYQSFSWVKRARLHFANTFLRGGGFAYLKQRFRNLADKLNWATGRGHRNAPDVPGLEMFSQDAIKQVWVALHKAYRIYRPSSKFSGRLIVIRADVLEDWDKYTSHDPLLGWGQWTGGPTQAHGIAVRHLDLFHEPTIHELAKIIEAAITSHDRQATAMVND